MSPVDTTLRSIANGGVVNGGVEERGRACFTKIFKGCPLHVLCAGSWIHPIREGMYNTKSILYIAVFFEDNNFFVNDLYPEIHVHGNNFHEYLVLCLFIQYRRAPFV